MNLPPEEGGYVLCRVEGCPRTLDDGQDEMCGLARMFGIDGGPWPYCGAELTVAAWERAGMFGRIEQDFGLDPVPVAVHHKEMKRGQSWFLPGSP